LGSLQQQIPHPEGRPKSLKTILKTDYSCTQTQCNDAIFSMLGMTKSEIETEVNNLESPIFDMIIAKALLKSYHNGSIYAIESLLNRSLGLPKQQSEI
jgi:hypothetical protein